ncbi:MAG: YkgJ family cysteine cluster protein [Spirochaetaceae bacterium]|jgi:Fe-S-cluster containining protein|nr:YkgJ family cysteine cluster protein [Spirochaetaceae bacterium]
MSAEKPFYEDGLHFSCRRCSLCCRRDEGCVFLTRDDLDALAKEHAMRREDFLLTYCRWVPIAYRDQLLSLKEKANNDCIFWKDGCAVYNARPLQCRSYPFWKNHLSGKENWDQATAECPGAGRGQHHTKEIIEAWIASEDANPIIRRTRP